MTKYDWSGVPSIVKFIATDEDGIVVGYTGKPKIYGDSNMWLCGECGDSVRVMNTVLSHQGNWQDSLEERPNE